jgi:hypothetical protein
VGPSLATEVKELGESRATRVVMSIAGTSRGQCMPANRKSLADVFGSEMATEVWDHFTVHYSPTHGSWLNQAEIEIWIFSRQCLGKGRIPDLETLREEAKAWNRSMNRDRVKIAWKFDRKAGSPEVQLQKEILHTVRDPGSTTGVRPSSGTRVEYGRALPVPSAANQAPGEPFCDCAYSPTPA